MQSLVIDGLTRGCVSTLQIEMIEAIENMNWTLHIPDGSIAAELTQASEVQVH